MTLSLGVVTNMCSRAAEIAVGEKLVAIVPSSKNPGGAARVTFHRLTEEYYSVREVK